MIMDGYDPESMKWSTALSAMDALVVMTAREGFGCLAYKRRVRKPAA